MNTYIKALEYLEGYNLFNWEDIDLPSGITPEKMWEDLESIASSKAAYHSSRNNFWFSKEDLEQEIMIKFIKALPKFQKDKSYYEKYNLYFSRCADNIVLDLKRKHLYYHKLPCKSCEHWKKKEHRCGEHDCSFYKNKENCVLYNKYIKLYRSKYSLGMSYGNYLGANSENEKDASGFIATTSGSNMRFYSESSFEAVDIEDFLISRLSEESSKILEEIIQQKYSCEKIDQEKLNKLRKEVTEI